MRLSVRLRECATRNELADACPPRTNRRAGHGVIGDVRVVSQEAKSGEAPAAEETQNRWQSRNQKGAPPLPEDSAALAPEAKGSSDEAPTAGGGTEAAVAPGRAIKAEATEEGGQTRAGGGCLPI